MWAWNQKAKNGDEMGGTSRIATCHDKDVLDVEVKRDIPQDMGLHLVARRASIDKDRPELMEMEPHQSVAYEYLPSS